MKKLFLFISFTVVIWGCKKDSYKSSNSADSWNDPVIPVSLTGIEAVNIDNAGELPKISNSSMKKEAYMIGIKWITEHTASDNQEFITDIIRQGEDLYSNLGNRYSKAIKCNTQFNASIDSGKYISKFFKAIEKNYLPEDVDEGFVLLVYPNPGIHSFRVEYYEGDELKFFHDTQPINFY